MTKPSFHEFIVCMFICVDGNLMSTYFLMLQHVRFYQVSFNLQCFKGILDKPFFVTEYSIIIVLFFCKHFDLPLFGHEKGIYNNNYLSDFPEIFGNQWTAEFTCI